MGKKDRFRTLVCFVRTEFPSPWAEIPAARESLSYSGSDKRKLSARRGLHADYFVIVKRLLNIIPITSN